MKNPILRLRVMSLPKPLWAFLSHWVRRALLSLWMRALLRLLVRNRLLFFLRKKIIRLIR